MNVSTFSGFLPSVNRSNNTVKTNSVSNKEIQTTLPVLKSAMPSSELLRVSFTGGYNFINDYKEGPYNHPNDVIEKKITNDDIKPNAELSDANLKEYNFTENGKTDIKGIKLKRALLSNASLEGVKISDEQNKADLSDAVCKNVVMNNVEMGYAKALRAKFVEAKFNGADLTHTDFRGGKFDSAEFNNGADLDNADFRDAWLLNADFTESKNIDTAKFDGAYYNLGTKFPEKFNPQKHDMILVVDDQGIRNEKVNEYLDTIKKYDKEID